MEGQPSEPVAPMRKVEELEGLVLELRLAEETSSQQLAEMKSLFDAVPLGIAYLDREFRFIEANGAFCHMAGIGREGLMGKACYDTVGEYSDDPSRAGAERVCSFCRKEECFRTKRPTLIERPLAGRTVTVRTVPEVDDTGEIHRFLELVEDITERKLAQESLRESEERFRAISDASLDAVVTMDADGMVAYWNPAAERMFGYSKDEVMGRDLHVLFASREAREKHLDALPSFRATGEGVVVGRTLELQSTRKDGSRFPIELSVASANIGGRWHAVGTVRDITGRRAAERAIQRSLEANEMLMREMHHRVKNNFLIVYSLLKLQSRHLKDKESLSLFQESQDRLMSMSLIHEKLSRSRDLMGISFSEYMKRLARHLFRSYSVDTSRVRLDLDVPDFAVDVEAMVPCGLIVNELVSNALKHAFPGGREGEVSVEFRPEGEGGFRLTVRDNGVGMPEGLDVGRAESLGLELVAMLSNQLGGAIDVGRTGGTSFNITFGRERFLPGRGLAP